MSEFIEIQEVAVRRGDDGERVIKDVSTFSINKDQIVSFAPAERASDCLSVLMVAGKPLLIRPHPALVKIEPPPKVESTKPVEPPKPDKAPKVVKSKSKSKHGYWD